MKKAQLFFTALGLLIALASCHRGKTTTIESSDNHHSTRLEYSGRIIFSTDSANISSMAPGSYFNYKRNGQKLSAENNMGHIVYELNGGDKTTRLDAEGKELLAEAIKMIAKLKGRHS